MLFRLMWHAGHYRIPEILDMTLFDCAISLGVDQHARRRKPYGAAEVDENVDVLDKLNTPTQVMVMSPEMLAAAAQFASPL